ncbi:MAG: hypothetical protein ISR65_15610 [Bacteriovoracaceae bacterium]|nr:hypothetical protein [Bacteriovoracaceae bacterium]
MQLQDLKKISSTNDVNVHTPRYLVVGNDLFSIAMYYYISQSVEESEVILLSPSEITVDDLTIRGPSTVRGDRNIGEFILQNPGVSLKKCEEKSSFYKDQKFHFFGGRSKPGKTTPEEEFFIESRVDFSLEDVFLFLKDEKFLDQLRDNCLVLNYTSVDSFVKNDEDLWRVQCSTGDLIESPYLIWGEDPSKFIDSLKSVKLFDDNFYQMCAKATSKDVLFVKYIFNEPISDNQSTMFIPLSVTHQWGHFIGELMPYEAGQQIEFLHFIDSDQTTEDEISKKIKTLRRNMEKIFPNFSKSLKDEFICLSELYSNGKPSNDEFDKTLCSAKTPHFIGVNAPLGPHQNGLSHFVRAVVSINNSQKELKF